MAKTYANPPVIEALCEFQFIPNQPWDITVTGLLYERIRKDFPEKQQRNVYGGGFRHSAAGMEFTGEISQRMQFYSSDRRLLVQVGPDLLTINHLKPYSNWDNFKPIILDTLKKYQEIALPKGLKRIGLRYINKVEFEKFPIELTEYFKYYPVIPEGLSQRHEIIDVHVEIPYEEDRDFLLLTLLTVPAQKPKVISLVLDLEYFMSVPERISLEKTPEWVEQAHKKIEIAFEACTTENCKKLFG